MSAVREEGAGGSSAVVADRTPPPGGRGPFLIRDVLPSDRAAVLTLVTRGWDERRRRDCDFFWDWKHALDRTTSHAGHVAQVLERDGRILAYAGTLPARFRLDGETVEGAYCCDLIAAPEDRGSGMRLMKHLLATCAFLFGSSNVRTQVLWERLVGRGTLTVRQARKMVLVLDPGPALRSRGASPLTVAGARAANRVLRLVHALTAGGGLPAGLTLESVRAFPQEIDSLCAEFASRFRFQVARDRAYLDWRFTTCPLRYRIVLLREHGTLRGYMVCRPASLNGRRVLLLVEMLAVGRAERHYKMMLRRLVAEAHEAGAAEIQTIDTGDPALLRAQLRAGFMRRAERLSIMACTGPGRATPDGLYGSDGWYVGLGDSEFEFTFFRQGADSQVSDGAAAEGAGGPE
jgi:hypothetical protein